MEQTRNEDDSRKNKRWNTEEGRVQKTKTWFHVKNWPQKFLNFFRAKKRYGDDEKKGKEEVWKEKWDQEQKREKKNEVKQKEDPQKRWWRKKDKETWDTEKKRRRNTEMEK